MRRIFSQAWGGIMAGMLFFSLLPGCGGGSVGTGTEPRIAKTTFVGAVTSEAGQPVAGALILLLNTKEAATSAPDGTFQLDSTLDGGTASFSVTAGQVQGSVDVANVPSDGAAVNLAVVVNFDDRTVSLNNLSITAKIEGNCDPFFENTRTIRQSGRVPDGTMCPLRVRTSSAAGPVSGVPFVLQRARCFAGAPWHDVGSGVTGNVAPGFGELAFAFSNAEEFCVYRIVVPYGIADLRPQIFNVDTFRKQAFDAGVAFDPNEGDGR